MNKFVRRNVISSQETVDITAFIHATLSSCAASFIGYYPRQIIWCLSTLVMIITTASSCWYHESCSPFDWRSLVVVTRDWLFIMLNSFTLQSLRYLKMNNALVSSKLLRTLEKMIFVFPLLFSRNRLLSHLVIAVKFCECLPQRKRHEPLSGKIFDAILNVFTTSLKCMEDKSIYSLEQQNRRNRSAASFVDCLIDLWKGD